MLNIEIPSLDENINSDSGNVQGTDLLKLFNGEHCEFAVLRNPGINGCFSGTADGYNAYADNEYYNYGLRFSIKLGEFQRFRQKCRQESNNDIYCSHMYYKNTKGRNLPYFYFGSYINNAVSLEKKNILDKMYSKGTLNKTDNKYHIVYSSSSNTKDAVDIEEYELEGEFFVRIVKKNNPTSAVKLSNGQYVYENGVYWLMIKPIKWIFNEDKKVFVSEKLYVPFVLDDKKRNYFGDFKNTHIKEYIDTYFLTEILYHTSKSFILSQFEESKEEGWRLRTSLLGYVMSGKLLGIEPDSDYLSEISARLSKKGILNNLFENIIIKKYIDKDSDSIKQANKK